MQLLFSVEGGEIRAVVCDKRVILHADLVINRQSLLSTEPGEVHVFTHVPGFMCDGGERCGKTLID